MSTFDETLPISDTDVRTIEATILLMWSSPILLEDLETILKDELKAYPYEEEGVIASSSSSSSSPSPLLSWLRSFRDLFEIRSVRGPDSGIVKVCGVAGMDDEYWEYGPESPRPEDLFNIPELSPCATIDGRVESIENDGLHCNIQVLNAAGVCREHVVPVLFQLSVHEGEDVKKGHRLISHSVMVPIPSGSEDGTNRFRYVEFERRVEHHPGADEYEDRSIGANVGRIIGDYLQHVEAPAPDSEDKRRNVLDSLTVGSHVKGTVKTIAYFGVFVDINGLDGLIHISNLSWSYVRHPRDIVKIGQELEVVVLEIDREQGHVSLGLKQLQKNPWDTIEVRHPVRSRLQGKVVNLVPYGAFVEIESGINGFVHISEFSWTRQIANAADMLKVGDEVTVVVTSIDKADRKIALSIREAEENPWNTVAERYPVGSRVKGLVISFAPYCAFVQLEDGVRGSIHISNLSWTRKINHPSEILMKGQEVETVVLEIDSTNQRISLGLKQTQEDPWKDAAASYETDQIVKGKISKIVSFGAFVELASGVEGLVHKSDAIYQIKQDKNALKEGQEVVVRIVRIDRDKRRIGLSLCDEYVPPSVPDPPKEDSAAERRAILAFWRKLNDAGWKYSLRDIVRFHTSVRTAALTILSGASGVGKSSLFKHYARFATASETDGELWKRMNVVSTWMEPSDMLGWRSPLASGVSGFQDAPGGLQAFLEGLQTKERSGKLSLLCFEEMNLAQAELYFSDFLQAVSDPSEDRKISNPRGGSFKIPNLRIVGTCNIDHTTKPFTERFLDRCNYIDLSAPDSESAVDQFFPAFCPDDNPSVPENGIPSFRQKTPSASGIKSVIDQKSQDDEDWAENWKQLAGVLKGLCVFPSRRVRVSMAEYILARPALLDLQETTLDDEKYYAEKEDNFLLGLDEALVQRVLPKLLLRGEWDKDDKFWKRVGLLKDLCNQKKLNLSLSYLFLGTHLEKGSMG